MNAIPVECNKYGNMEIQGLVRSHSVSWDHNNLKGFDLSIINMLGSRRVLQAISRRSFATSTTPENPRFKIASNLLKLQAIRAASDEASLKAAVEAKYVIDPSKLPADLKPLEGYLASAPPASGKFQYNSEFWQNKPFLEYVQIEAQRDYTWPFLVGAV